MAPHFDHSYRPSVKLDEFGAHVRQLRLGQSLTQEQLAERCSLSADTIRRVENGSLSPSLMTLVKLAAGLTMSLSSIFAGVEGEDGEHTRQLVDLVSSRSEAQQRQALRLIRALFDDGS